MTPGADHRSDDEPGSLVRFEAMLGEPDRARSHE